MTCSLQLVQRSRIERKKRRRKKKEKRQGFGGWGGGVGGNEINISVLSLLMGYSCCLILLHEWYATNFSHDYLLLLPIISMINI